MVKDTSISMGGSRAGQDDPQGSRRDALLAGALWCLGLGIALFMFRLWRGPLGGMMPISMSRWHASWWTTAWGCTAFPGRA